MTTGIYFKGLVFERTILLKLCPFKAVCVSSGHYRGVEKDPLLKPWSGDVIVFDPFDSLWLANYFLGDTDDSLNFGVRTLEEIRLRKALKASMRIAGEFILPLSSPMHRPLPFVSSSILENCHFRNYWQTLVVIKKIGLFISEHLSFLLLLVIWCEFINCPCLSGYPVPGQGSDQRNNGMSSEKENMKSFIRPSLFTAKDGKNHWTLI